jgi:hypothetical protein
MTSNLSWSCLAILVGC